MEEKRTSQHCVKKMRRAAELKDWWENSVRYSDGRDTVVRDYSYVSLIIDIERIKELRANDDPDFYELEQLEDKHDRLETLHKAFEEAWQTKKEFEIGYEKLIKKMNFFFFCLEEVQHWEQIDD